MARSMEEKLVAGGSRRSGRRHVNWIGPLRPVASVPTTPIIPARDGSLNPAVGWSLTMHKEVRASTWAILATAVAGFGLAGGCGLKGPPAFDPIPFQQP